MADQYKSKGAGSPYEHKTKRSWEESFQALARYHEKNGDCAVPMGHEKDPALGQWVHAQRVHQDSLTHYQKLRLMKLGFDFKTRQQHKDKLWRAQYERLIVFKSIFGHTRIPQRTKCEEMKPWAEELGTWVTCQRGRAKKNTFPPWQRSMLDDISFEYKQSHPKRHPTMKMDKMKKGDDLATPVNYRGGNPYERAWYEKYNRLVKFKNENGHTIVPIQNKKDQELGRWVSAQRVAYHRNQLLRKRTRLLDKIGFIWDAHERNWYEKYNRLVKFRNENGHTMVPTHQKKDRELGHWVSTQRNCFQQNKMPPERKRLLDNLGFTWDASQLPWNQQLKRVIQFKAVHGHLEIPRGYGNTGLGYGLCDQKDKAPNGELATKPAEKLLSIGVELRGGYSALKRSCGHVNQCCLEGKSQSSPNSREELWQENLQKFAAYKAQHGFFPPRVAGAYDSLNGWGRTQQTRERNGVLPPHQRAQLDSIGFWDCNLQSQKVKKKASSDDNHDSNMAEGCRNNQRQTFEQHEQHEQQSEDEGPYYPVGARFYKLFAGSRAFQGEIMSFDGSHYTVWYEDGDEEHLKPKDLEEVYFILSEDGGSNGESDDNVEIDQKAQST
ncbi:helicase [Seminavis robusta]|uniref:Helicase n=1 Tax=Seminavis robusta TaxID=568900 RepID=A0A9N8EBY2_9STRA|nr:helicase [Seminavis robusta]|eukprot:Sro867_g213130.1 helicase (608) ;mRNA; r:5307-7203